MRYWIREGDDTPQRFPLQRLLRKVFEVAGPGNSKTCRVFRAQGYGIQIKEWCERLDRCEYLVLPIEVLDRVSQGTEEWFYDLEAGLGDPEVLFGLHDSTALFVEAEPAVAAAVASVFAGVGIALGRERH